MSRLIPSLGWSVDGDRPQPLDARLIPLLAAIARTGSLAAAVGDCGLSYRAGWGLLRESQRNLGVALVRLEQGKGATLSSAGIRWVDADIDASRRLARMARTVSVELGEKGARAESRLKRLQLRIAASHDLALAAMRDGLPEASALNLDLVFMGSLNALEAFHAGTAEVAGFHMAMDAAGAPERERLLRLVSPRRDRLIRFVDRAQGLILPAGNPARLKSIRDVASKRITFVNRQRGSGTRMIIDRMLREAGVSPGALVGYSNEEFTHHAVAATVASCGAGATIGLEAAARAYGLAFVPLVRERYYFACRASDVEKPAIRRLIEVLRGPEFAKIVRRLRGYRATDAGTVTIPRSTLRGTA